MRTLRDFLQNLLYPPPDPTRFARCGRNVHIQNCCRFYSVENLSVGNDVYIGPEAWIDAQGHVTICDGSVIGPRLKLYSASHNYRSDRLVPYDEKILNGPVIIGANTWIGGDVIIVPGVEIGEGCVVGAGAVVTRSHPACTILGGNPARQIGLRDPAIYARLKAKEHIYMRTWTGPTKTVMRIRPEQQEP